MEKIMSLRLKKQELGYIKELSKFKKTDNSEAARELIAAGWTYHILMRIKDGGLSLGKAARLLNITISELIDLLSDLGIRSAVDYGDYLEGLKVAENL